MEFDRLYEYLRGLRGQATALFRDYGIYIGGIDWRYSGDDLLFDIYEDFPPSGLRICMSSYDKTRVIPWALLEKLNALDEKACLTIEQAPSGGVKGLYMYINIDLDIDTINDLLPI